MRAGRSARFTATCSPMWRTTSFERLALFVFAMGATVPPSRAYAFGSFAAGLPCADSLAERCVTCHVDRDGGSSCASPPCLNDFGRALRADGWGPMLASLDADGDGFTNGDELGDPEGTWAPGQPIDCRCATFPADASASPAIDGDGDGVCCRGGRDADRDAVCDGEGTPDCDDTRADVSPDLAEMCDHADLDQDCDGLLAIDDEDCADLHDRDGDGICPGGGVDLDGDGTCIGEHELDPIDCDDDDASVHPRMAEDCDNGIDDDCDGLVDREDPSCGCVSDAECDDGDPCTRDRCASSACTTEPVCFDAEPAIDAGPGDASLDASTRGTHVTYGCGCQAAPSSRGMLFAFGVPVLLLASRRRRVTLRA